MLDDEALNMLGIADPTQEFVLVGGAHEAADRSNRSLALWQPRVQSADMDIVPEKMRIDGRARDMLRNDAYVRGGAILHKDNIVGSHYVLNAKPVGRVLGAGFDETWAAEFQEEVEDRFTLWAESPDNWVDASRRNTFTEMVRLAVGLHTATGEVLGAFEWLRDGGRPFNTALQFIDTDRLSTPPDMLNNDRIVAGVEMNAKGAPIRYHFRVHHPAEWRRMRDNYRWRSVAVRKPWGRLQILHIFDQTRPDQTRGITEMVAALKEMRQTRQFRDVTLQNAVLNATYAATVESELPPGQVFEALGEVNNPSSGLVNYISDYFSQVANYEVHAKNLQLDGVRVPHLYPGTKLNLRPAGKGGPLGQEFEQSLLRYIAASLGVSYEQLSRDYTQTNYSSARAAMAETWKHMNAVKRAVADRFASAIYRNWLEEVVNKGVISSMPAVSRREGWLYEDQRLDALTNCDWIGASRGQIDELKETQAAVLRLRHNLTTEEDEIARMGRDWRQVKRQRAREKAMDDELGLTPVEDDNMMNAASGDVRDDQTDGEPSETDDGDPDA